LIAVTFALVVREIYQNCEINKEINITTNYFARVFGQSLKKHAL